MNRMFVLCIALSACVAQPPPRQVWAATSVQNCREYTADVTIDDQKQPVHGWICPQPDGSWKIANAPEPPVEQGGVPVAPQASVVYPVIIPYPAYSYWGYSPGYWGYDPLWARPWGPPFWEPPFFGPHVGIGAAFFFGGHRRFHHRRFDDDRFFVHHGQIHQFRQFHQGGFHRHW